MAYQPKDVKYTVKTIGTGGTVKAQRGKMLLGFGALIINVAILGGAIIFLGGGSNEPATQTFVQQDSSEAQQLIIPRTDESVLNTVSNEIELPESTTPKRFSEDMEKILSEYGSNNQNFPKIEDVNWKLQITADFNDDGYDDLFWRNDTSFITLVWLMENQTVKDIVNLPTIDSPGWRIVGFQDFNLDGKKDIAWRSSDRIDLQDKILIWLMDGTQIRGEINFTILLDNPWDWKVIGFTDGNEDGSIDLVLANSNRSSEFYNRAVIYYLKSSNEGAELNNSLEPTWITYNQEVLDNIENIEILKAADFNLDGYIDLMWQRDGTKNSLEAQETDGFFIWLTDEKELIQKLVLTDAYSANWTPFLGDFNNDSNIDIFWRQQFENNTELIDPRNNCPGGGSMWFLNRVFRNNIVVDLEVTDCER
jgi:hypothetical protein